MNFLGHLYLSRQYPGLLVGNFMGDFVKGRLDERLPRNIRLGVDVHRRIDSLLQAQPLFERDRSRLASRYGRYRGVMIDLFYDHILALRWEELSGEPLAPFLRMARRHVEISREWVPDSLVRIVPYIFDELIPSYDTVSGIGLALRRMARRIPRCNPLEGGEGELLLHRDALTESLMLLIPLMERLVHQEIPRLAMKHGGGVDFGTEGVKFN